MNNFQPKLVENKEEGHVPSSAFQQTEKLTKWANEPTLEILQGDLDNARPAHNAQIAKINHWVDLMKGAGKAAPPKIKGRSSIQPKLIRKQAEWRYSALSEPFLGSDKIFAVKPVTHEDTQSARQNELLLNWQFRSKLNRVKFIDDYVRTVVDEGTGIIQVGWDRVVKTVKEKAPVYDFFQITDQQDYDLLQQGIQLQEENPTVFDTEADPALKAAVEYFQETGEITVAVQSGTEDVEVEKVLTNKPSLKIHHFRNVLIDPTAEGDIEKALFVMVSFEASRADLEKNQGRYKNLDKVNWESAAASNMLDAAGNTAEDSRTGGFKFKDAGRKKAVVYEYWGFYDIHKTGQLEPFVATWVGGTLVRMEESPCPDKKLPFTVVTYLPVKREIYGEPDAELLEENQQLLGATVRGITDLLGRSANGQQGIAKGLLDPLNRRRYDQGQDYEFNPNMSPAQGIIEHKFPEVPQSAMLMVQLQNQEAESFTGVKAFSGGLSGTAYGDVAAGIRGMLDAASKREMGILRRLAYGLVEIGRKIIAMNQEFLSDIEIVRVTNDNHVIIRRDEIQGEFDLIVDISTAEIDDAKSQDLGFMLQTLGPNMDPTINMMLLSDIAELKRMPELAERLRKWEPKPDPAAEELKRLQVEEQQLKNDLLRSEIALNEAKAQQVTAIADKTNLDYVEQESGTKHEREMAKQKGQSQGNQALEVTKALLKPKKREESKPDIAAAVGYNALSDKLNEGNGSAPDFDSFGAPNGNEAPIGLTNPRNLLPPDDPRGNIGSSFFDPAMDAATNQRLNF